MSRLYPGDYVRPNSPSLGLPRNSIWFVRPSPSFAAIRIEPVAGTSSGAISSAAWRGRNFSESNFDKVVRVRGSWVDVKDADALMSDPAPFYNPDALLRDILESQLRASMTTAVANGAGTLSCTQAVDPVQAALSIADNAVVSAEQKLADAKEQARKQREVAAQKAKEQAKAEREAKAKAEVKAKRDALLLRLQADERLADATKALILEVQSLVKYATPERIAPQEVFQHADQLDALAKSYGYKIVRAGSKCIVAKA